MSGSGITRVSDTLSAVFLLALVVLLAAPPTARAGEIADQAARAENLMERGYPAPALTAFDQAAAAVWSASPLQLRTAQFVESVSGYAEYTPRPDEPYQPGDTLTVYLEPFGFGFMPTSNGFRSTIVADIRIRTPGGLVLAAADDFVRLEWLGRNRRREVHAAIKMPLPDLKPGAYVLDLTLRDQGSKKQAKTALPFSVIE
ncbi:MAG: hypothetical protein GY798_30770 [Hyphomicrobiales bacterium]|nr:hypothetical protein [Hyphomicrobiales bacterium]